MDLNIIHEIGAEEIALTVDDMTYEYQRAFWLEVATKLRQFDSTGRSVDMLRAAIDVLIPPEAPGDGST